MDSLKEKSLDERLAARHSHLSPAEQRVARFFAQYREEVAFLSALEIGQRIGTSDATVVRTAQSLGYSGVPDLKLELSRDLRTKVSPATRLRHSLRQIHQEPEAALDHAFTVQIELLEEVRRTAKREDFGHAIDIFQKANRVFTYGVGPSKALADYFAFCLRRFGHPATAMGSTGLRLADELLDIRPGDAVLLMVYDRIYREVEVMLDRTQELNVPVVLLTDSMGFALADRTQVVLPARRGRSGMLSTVTTSLVFMDALLLGLAACKGSRSLATLEELNRLRAKIAGGAVDISRGPLGEEV